MLSRITTKPIQHVLTVIILLCTAHATHAQFNSSVQGTVTDTAGAIIPNVSVTLVNNETARVQTTTTSDDGFYRFTGLAPGSYNLNAETSGFKKGSIENITVNAEGTQGFDIVLTTGEVSETVTVTSEGAQPLETENANVNKVITTIDVLRLPQVGRDPYELARLTPGVFGDGARSGSGNSVGLPNTTGPGGSNSSIYQVENQVPITANGQRVSANNFQIDGVSVNSLGFGGAAVITPNQESVKEVRILSSSYSAEDGRNSGAQIKVVSQNGTNDFHGSAFFKYNDPALNSFNKYGGFNNAAPVRVENRFRQFGGSLGGPIVRNSLFFFFSYEGLRNNSTTSSNVFVETPQYRDLIRRIRPNGVTSAVLASQGIEPRIANVLPVDCSRFGNDPARCNVVAGGLDIGSPTGAQGQYISLGNPAGGGLDGIPDIQFAQIFSPNQVRGSQFNPRIDYLRGNDTFAFSAFLTRQNSTGSDPGAASRPGADLRFKPFNSSATLTWNRVLSPTTLNEARFNVTRFALNQVESSAETNFGIPRIEIEGLPFDRIRFGAPRGEASPGIFAQNTYEFNDTLSKVFGNHATKIGVSIRKEQDNNNLVGGARPLYTFSGLFNFANDAPIFESINADPRTGSTADIQRYFRTTNYAFFAQDDWKLRPNLTINLGVRYEYFTPPGEKEDRITNLEFGQRGLVDSRVVLRDRLFEPDRNNFAPRLGFAYSPARFNDKLVLRGGFGISYNRIPNVLFANTRGNPPFLVRYNICCGTAATDFGSPFVGGQILYALGANNSPFSFPANPVLAQGIDPATNGPAVGEAEVYGSPNEVPNAYVYAFSFEGQYDLPAKLVATLGYQGSSGHKLIRLVNQNFLFPRSPRFFAVFFVQPDVNSNYHAMNARLTRRFSDGLQLDAIYRWSKSIDTLSYEGPGGETNQTNPGDLASERGPSDFDVRHHFVFSGLYDLPFFRGRKDALGAILGGFQINTILTAHTGFPWTPKIENSLRQPGGDFIGPIRPTRYFGGALDDSSDEAFIRPGGNFPGGGARYFDVASTGQPGIGRNSFRGPQFMSVDLSFVKQTALPAFLRLGEAANLELRANFFNAFNQLNLEPFRFFSPGVFANRPEFGRAERALSGRVVELQARFSF